MRPRPSLAALMAVALLLLGAGDRPRPSASGGTPAATASGDEGDSGRPRRIRTAPGGGARPGGGGTDEETGGALFGPSPTEPGPGVESEREWCKHLALNEDFLVFFFVMLAC